MAVIEPAIPFALTDVGKCFAVLVTITLLSIAVYRIKFHPYAKYPGPWLAKITNLYSLYHAHKGDLHIDQWAAHQRYGVVVRMGPNRLIFNSSTAAREIYNTGKNLQKSHSYSGLAMGKGAYSSFTVVDITAHARKRRFTSQAFSEVALNSYEPTILKHVRSFCAKLGDFDPGDGHINEKPVWGVAKNVSHWTNFYVFDVITNLAFGDSLELLTDKKNREIVHMVNTMSALMNFRTECPRMAATLVENILSRRVITRVRKYVGMVNMMVTKRITNQSHVLETETEARDMFSHMLKAEDPETGEGLPFPELCADGSYFVFGGSDTTSTTIATVFFQLSRNSSAYNKLCSEIRSNFESAESIKHGPALGSCQYLRACIDEALRLSPPVGQALWREVRQDGLTINGEAIPVGYDVGVSAYALHHNSDYYQNPFEFIPERWIIGESTKETEESIAAAKSAFIPFSLGTRGCIGKGFAYRELSLTLAMIIWMYDFRIPSNPRLASIGEGSRHRG